MRFYHFILFENQIQTTSTSPCRTQVQPAASFLVCSLIFIEYHFKIFRKFFQEAFKVFSNKANKKRFIIPIKINMEIIKPLLV